MTLGVLGGTFDPIHLGHLAAGDAAQQALSFDSMLLIPSRIPPHRADPVRPGLKSIRDGEARRQGAAGVDGVADRAGSRGRSYTYDTLLELREAMSEGRGIDGGRVEGRFFS